MKVISIDVFHPHMVVCCWEHKACIKQGEVKSHVRTREQVLGEDIPSPRHPFPLALSKLTNVEVKGQGQGHARFAFS